VVCLVRKEGEIVGTVGEDGAEDADRDGKEDIVAMVILMRGISGSLGLGMTVQQLDE